MRPVSGDYKVYKINKDTVEPAFKLDFGDMALPENYFEHHPKLNYRSDYLKEIHNIHKLSKDHVYFECIGPGGYTHMGLLDQENRKVISFGKQDYPFVPTIACWDGQFIYGYYEPVRIKEALEKETTDHILFNHLKPLKNTIDEDDNPLLVKFKLMEKN